MRRLSFRSVLIAVAGGFFLLGIISTLVRPAHPRSTAGASPTARASASITTTVSPPADGDQTTVVILGVDSLEAKKPQLLAAWIVSFRPPDRDLFVLGLPTDWATPDGATLAQAFEATRGQGADFAAALDAVTPLPRDLVIVLDSEGFAAVIDFLGGVPSGEETIDGSAALGVLDLLSDDPRASLQAQYRLLQALAGRADRVQPGTDLKPLLSLVPDHASLSVSQPEAIARIAPVLPFDPELIHIGLPGNPPPPSTP
jgi:hypothetical protein